MTVVFYNVQYTSKQKEANKQKSIPVLSFGFHNAVSLTPNII